ncbi:MAG: hypothetical protein PHY11_03860 [Bacilli bacterium]|nr:hypothetical protein [Bacilli bacterium]
MKEKARKRLISKSISNGLLIIIGIVVITCFLNFMQLRASQMKQEEDSTRTLNQIIVTLDDNASQVEMLTYRFHDTNQSTTNSVVDLFMDGKFTSMFSMPIEDACDEFASIQSSVGASLLLLVNNDGQIVLAPSTSYLGVSLKDNGFTQAMIDELTTFNDTRRGTEVLATNDNVASYAPVYIMNSYVYGTPLATKTTSYGYFLLMGAKEEMLEYELANLKDVGSMLGTYTVGTDGFAFAVDTSTGTFKYFNDGKANLSGKSYADYGLTNAALENDYVGTQVINGVSYFCVSKTYESTIYGKYTVLTAVVSSQSLVAGRFNVLIWSVLAFIMVSLLIALYTSLLSMDYIATGKEPAKFVLFKNKKNTFYYNKSVGRKVLPISVVGLIIMKTSNVLKLYLKKSSHVLRKNSLLLLMDLSIRALLN